MEERQLIKRAVKGDMDAFEQLARAYQSKIYALALRIMKNEQDAFDASQEALVKLYKNLSGFGFRASFATWVYTITRNACLDLLRNRNSRDFVDIATVEFSLYAPEEESSPEVGLERQELRRQIISIMNQLPEEQKQTIVLRDVEGYPYEDICQLLNCSLGTVKSRLFRGREKIRKALKNMEK